MSNNTIKEISRNGVSGYPVLVILPVLLSIAAVVVWKVVDSAEAIFELDDERKAVMVSNLLVVLCGEENAQPVLNTGSLYS